MSSVDVWRIATATPDYEPDDLTGAGARKSGGRWNAVGTPVMYCATSRSLACLETLVHLAASPLPLNRYLVRIGVADVAWRAATVLQAANAPATWGAIPVAASSVQWGQDWLRARTSVLALVPSVIVPEEHNVLINPEHPDAKTQITAEIVRPWFYDRRLGSP